MSLAQSGDGCGIFFGSFFACFWMMNIENWYSAPYFFLESGSEAKLVDSTMARTASNQTGNLSS